MVPNPFRKPGARERATIEKIVAKKIMVSPERVKELEALRTKLQATAPPQEGTKVNVLVVYLTPPTLDKHQAETPDVQSNHSGSSRQGKGGEGNEPGVATPFLTRAPGFRQDSQGASTSGLEMSIAQELRLEESLAVQEVELPGNGWKVFKERLGHKAAFKADVIVMTIYGDVLSDMAKTVAATSTLQSMPILSFALPDCTQVVEDQVFEYTGCTWPVFRDRQKLAEYVSEELPFILRLRDAIASDVNDRVKEFKQLNPIKHGLKRAAVALVPFGVAAVNMAGMVRLCGRMMIRTGMVGDKESQKVVATLGTLTAGKVILFDELGDIYQYVIYATVLSDFALASSLEAAVQTLSIADGFLLGSVTVVTGAVSAVGAYLTRPNLVDTIAAFLANLQLIYLLNPKMRRTPEETSTSAASGRPMSEEEKLRLLDHALPPDDHHR